METPLSFGEILDAADKLSLDDQVELIRVLRHRVAEHRRDLLAEEIEQARREFKVGQCQPMPPADILKAVVPGPDLELPWLLRSGGLSRGSPLWPVAGKAQMS
jgi:hypothetical protein